MEPSEIQVPDLARGPEGAPQQQTTPETPAPQVGPESAPEKPQFDSEKSIQPERQTSAQPAAPAAPPVPVTDQPVAKAPATPPKDDDDDTPAIAQDVDVIEREWVNKAKAEIERTKDDPHAQEAAFEKLQTEYLKKRYGYRRDLGAAA